MKKQHEVIDNKLYLNGEFCENKSQVLLFNSERKRIFVNGLLVENPFIPESHDELYDYIEKSFNGVSRDEIEILPDLSNVYTGFLEDLSDLFYGMTKLKDISGISSWNVCQVSNVNGLFGYCRDLKDISPLSNWKLINIKRLDNMFYRCIELEDISYLKNVFCESNNIISLESFLSACFNLKSLDGLQNMNVSKVQWFQYMCESCFELNDISALKDWKFENKNKYIRRMFAKCENLKDISPIYSLFESTKIDFLDSEIFNGCTKIDTIHKEFIADSICLTDKTSIELFDKYFIEEKR